MIFILIFAQCILAAVVALVLARTLPAWSRRRIVIISPLPLPLVILGVCAFVFGNAAFAPKEECGVDACGMAMAGAMFGAVAAMVLYGIGAVCSAVTAQLGRKSMTVDVTDVFS